MEPNQTTSSPSFLTKPWLRYTVGIGAIFLVAFGLLGSFWLPGFAKQKLEEALSRQLHRPVTVQEIDVSPYALSVSVRGFAVGELPARAAAKGAANPATPVLAFDELFINLSVMSIVRRAPVVSEVRLVAPRIYLERDTDGRYSVSDLLDEWMNKPAEPESKDSPARFSVANIQISGGRIDFIDHPKASHQEIADLKLGIPFLTNMASSEPVWVEPHFSAKVNGAEIALEGKALPFAERREAVLALKFKDLDLTRIDEYAPLPLKLKLAALKLDSDLSLSFAQAVNAAPEITLSGTLRLHDLELQETTKGRSLLTLKALDVRLGALDVTKKIVRFERILLQGLHADVLRRKDGKLEIAALMASSAPVQKTASPAPKGADEANAKWSVGADDTLLEDIRLRYRDDSVPTPFIATVGKLDVTLRNFELDSDTPILFESQVADVSVRRTADKAALFSLPAASISAGSASLTKREVMLTSIAVQSHDCRWYAMPTGYSTCCCSAPRQLLLVQAKLRAHRPLRQHGKPRLRHSLSTMAESISSTRH